MTAKKRVRIPVGTMQVVELREITDPAEIAWYDERRRRGKEIERARQRLEALELLKDLTVAEALKLARRLSPQQRLELVTKLVSGLPDGKRLELLEQLSIASKNGTGRPAVSGPKRRPVAEASR